MVAVDALSRSRHPTAAAQERCGAIRFGEHLGKRLDHRIRHVDGIEFTVG
jgi:hypothetical protein